MQNTLLLLIAAVSVASLIISLFVAARIKTVHYLLQQPVVKKMSPQLRLKPVKLDENGNRNREGRDNRGEGRGERRDGREGRDNRGEGRGDRREGRDGRENRGEGRGERREGREGRGGRGERCDGREARDENRGEGRGERRENRGEGRDESRGEGRGERREGRGDRREGRENRGEGRGERRDGRDGREPRDENRNEGREQSAPAESAPSPAPAPAAAEAPALPARRPLATYDAPAASSSAPESSLSDAFVGAGNDDVQHGRRTQLKKKPRIDIDESEVEIKV